MPDKNKIAELKITVKRADELEVNSYIAKPQHPTGVLKVYMVTGVKILDDCKLVEITTEGGIISLFQPEDLVFNLH